MLDPTAASTLVADVLAADILAADILAWTDGWARSRRASSPRPIDGGVHIHVGSEAEHGRYVLTAPQVDRVAELAADVVDAVFWIKWPAAAGDRDPRLPSGWAMGQPLHLMGATLRPQGPAPVPNGYRLQLTDEGDALDVRVTTDAGELAARGRLGLAERAVPDQIVTEPVHQRRGLGRVVMTTLLAAAVDRGRGEAILLASDQGRALYTALGWRVLTPFREAVLRG